MNFQLTLEVNNGMNWLPIIILFITWAYTLYKWMKSERELNKIVYMASDEDIDKAMQEWKRFKG